MYKQVFTEKLLVLFGPRYCFTIIYKTEDVFLHLTVIIAITRQGSTLANICKSSTMMSEEAALD